MIAFLPALAVVATAPAFGSVARTDCALVASIVSSSCSVGGAFPADL